MLKLTCSLLLLAACGSAQDPAAGSADSQPVREPIPVLVIGGANNHDWEWTTPALKKLLAETGRFSVDVTTDPATTLADAAGLRKYRAFVLDYNGPQWSDAAKTAFLDAVRGGVGVAVIHAANNAFPGWVEYEKLVGHMWRKGTGHGRFHAFDVRVVDRDHPITRGMSDLRQHPDELYHRLVHMHDAQHRVLATALSSKESGGTGNDEPMLMVGSYGEGRVFHTPLGHVWREVPGSRASWADPQYRALVARGTEWAATGMVTLPDGFATRLSVAEKAAGFRLVFDGETTAGWRGYRSESFPARGWEVENGALKCLAGGGGGDVAIDEVFGDVELRFQWKVSPGANSGVIYRVSEDEKNSYQTGPEYQVLDDAKHASADARHRSGALYGLVAAKGQTPRATGEWNDARIVLHGMHVEHWLNGTKVVDCDLSGDAWTKMVAASKFAKWPKFGRNAKGLLVFQDHGNTVWYRLIRVRPLP